MAFTRAKNFEETESMFRELDMTRSDYQEKKGEEISESDLVFTAWLAMDDTMNKELQRVGIKQGEPEEGDYVKVKEAVLEIIRKQEDRNALRQQSVNKGIGDGDIVMGALAASPIEEPRPTARPARAIKEKITWMSSATREEIRKKARAKDL